MLGSGHGMIAHWLFKAFPVLVLACCVLNMEGRADGEAEFLAGTSKTCPRCASHSRQETSVRTIPILLSVVSSTFSFAMGAQKLGQPVPESNFVSERKSAVPQHTQRYSPAEWFSSYSL